MSTTHPVDLRYTKEELLTIFAIATKEDVDLGGHYNCQGGAITVWSHPWNNAAVRYDSSTIGAFYVNWMDERMHTVYGASYRYSGLDSVGIFGVSAKQKNATKTFQVRF